MSGSMNLFLQIVVLALVFSSVINLRLRRDLQRRVWRLETRVVSLECLALTKLEAELEKKK